MNLLFLTLLLRKRPRFFLIDILVGFVGQCHNFTNCSAKLTRLVGLCNRVACIDKASLFAEHYAAVLNTPEGTDHQNIRQFMQHGWDGVTFEGEALQAK